MRLRFQCALALLIALSAQSAHAGGRTNRDGVSADVDAAVLRQMKDQHIPGIGLAVVRDGKVIKAKGYGLANIELDTPVSPDTVFEAGSITKQFTATAIMLLAEAGK